MIIALMVKEKLLNDLERETVLALADNRMNLTNASKVMHKHRNSLIYHIKKIKRKTGLDARDFHDLCELYRIAKRERKAL